MIFKIPFFTNMQQKKYKVEKTYLIDYFNINNRKYIGSKYRLLDFIEEIILNKVKKINTFCDIFAGTGVVANHFKQYSKQVIANDNLYSNYIAPKQHLKKFPKLYHT